MGKRTKAEKQKAAVRRFEVSESEGGYVLGKMAEKQVTRGASEVIDRREFGGLKRDLVKTAVLATLAFSFELCLYWVGR